MSPDRKLAWSVAPGPLVADRARRHSETFAAAFDRSSVTQDGTGLILQSLTGLTLPLIGQLGNVVVDQAIITELVTVEDVVGNIIGVQAEGVLTLTGGVLGTDVITEDFFTSVQIAKQGQGCNALTVDLAPIALDALGGLVSVNLPAAAVRANTRGGLGSLLCQLSQALLQPPTTATTDLIRSLLDQINQLLI